VLFALVVVELAPVTARRLSERQRREGQCCHDESAHVVRPPVAGTDEGDARAFNHRRKHPGQQAFARPALSGRAHGERRTDREGGGVRGGAPHSPGGTATTPAPHGRAAACAPAPSPVANRRSSAPPAGAASASSRSAAAAAARRSR